MFCLVSTVHAQREVSGVVTADGSGNPLDGVQVCAAHPDNGYTGWECAPTGGTGSYRVVNLEARNDYVVWVDHPGNHAFFREMHDNKPCCPFEEGTPVDLSSGNAIVDFGLAASGSISGRVLDSITGEPVRGLELWLYADGCEFVDTSYTFTNDDGTYMKSGVPDGTFFVYTVARRVGYISELHPDSKVFTACEKDFAGAQAVVIQDQTQLSGIDFKLDRGAVIRGRISTANPEYPWNFFRARLQDAADGTTFFTSPAFADDGSYELLGLQPGSYHVVLTGQRYNEFTGSGVGLIDERYDNVPCPRNSCSTNLGQVISVSGTQEVTGVDAVLETGAQIRGRVTDASSGEGVPNFCVAIYNSLGKYAGFGCTNENGDYESWNGFPDGQYLLANQFQVNDPLAVRGGWVPQVWKADGSFGNCGDPCDFLRGDAITVSGLDAVQGINLAMEFGTGIAGQVWVAGQPLSGAAVVLLDGNSAQEVFTVHTDAEGSYFFDGLGSGGYYVRTLNGQGYEDRLHGDPVDIPCNPDCDPFDGELIELTPTSETVFVDFDLTSAARIAGRVIDPGSNPVAGVRVEAYSVYGFFVSSAASNALGDYEIDGLGGGQYYVRTRDAFGFADALYDGLPCPADCRVQDGTPVQLSDGQALAGVDLRLIHAATITGKVTGQQADGPDVDLPGAVIEIYSEFGALAASVVTDLQGGYRVTGLAPGAYHVVTRNGGDYIDQDANGELCSVNCDPLATAPVIVQPQQVKQLNFSLFVSNSLFVQVIHDNGRALPGITVAAYDAAGDEFTRGTTNPSGRMELFGFSAGGYYLRTFNDQGFVEQVYDGLPCTETCDPLQGTRITLEEGDSASADFVLSGGFSISGQIRQAGTNPPAGIAGVTMLLGDVNFVFPLRVVTTGADGRYEFTGLTIDSYFLRTWGHHDYIDRVYGGESCTPGRCRMREGTVININGANVSGINLSLQAGMEISGYAQDAGGTAITDGWAVLFGAGGEYLTVFSSLNDDGTFILKGIAAGDYFLFLRSLNSQLVDTLYDGIPCPGYSCDITSGTPIKLGGGNSLTRHAGPIGLNKIRIRPNGVAVTITATTGHELRGSLTTDDGAPVRSTRVYFFNEDGTPASDAITDGAGEFVSTAALPDGIYFAATSRAARPEDEPDEAEDAEDGAGKGLQDQAWTGFPCDGLCAPSAATGVGTPIVVQGGSVDGIDIVLQRAPGVSIVTTTNGLDAPTPNSGDAPEIAAGEAVNWTYTVSNTGPGQLSGIVVTDSQGQQVACPKNSLADGGSMECTASATAADLSTDPFDGVLGHCGGGTDVRQYQTTGSVTATSGGANVMDADDSHYCNPQNNTIQINAGLNDAWYYPPTAGQGFLINVFEDRGEIFLAWFTYDKDRPAPGLDADLGEPGHRWLTAQGKYNGHRAVLDIFSTSGGEFDQGTAVKNKPDGTLVVEFQSCARGTITYDIDSINQQGVVPIQRIVSDNVAACEERSGAAAPTQSEGHRPVAESANAFGINWGMNDAWYNPSTSGQGLLIVVFPVIEQVFTAWFTYETERPGSEAEAQLGDPGHRWITAQGPFSGSKAELDIVVSEGGRFDSGSPAPVNHTDGTIVLEFSDCENATASYNIPSIGRQGEVALQRIAPDMVSICESLSAAPQK